MCIVSTKCPKHGLKNMRVDISEQNQDIFIFRFLPSWLYNVKIHHSIPSVWKRQSKEQTFIISGQKYSIRTYNIRKKYTSGEHF